MVSRSEDPLQNEPREERGFLLWETLLQSEAVKDLVFVTRSSSLMEDKLSQWLLAAGCL